MRDAWDAHAPEWIAWARTPGHDSYWQFHRDAFLPLVPPPGRLSLDLGCGEGRLSRDLAALGHRVVALDASPAMAASAAGHGGTRNPVVVGDAAALPIRAGAVDLVVAFMCLQDVDALEDALTETSRVLAPGGRLVVAITHPASTTGAFEPGPVETKRRFVVERSWFDRARIGAVVERDGLSMTFVSEHRPLQDYVEAIVRAGLLVEALREVGDPRPDDKWHRMPMFLHLVARRG
jgi:SAM-dependent methyltransferase